MVIREDIPEEITIKLNECCILSNMYESLKPEDE